MATRTRRTKKVDIGSQRSLTIPIGTPSPGETEAVMHIHAKPSAPLALELPGGILRIGKNYLPTIIPFVRVSIKGKGKPAKSALARFAERDVSETDKALRRLAEAAQRKPIEGFGLHITTDGLTFGELVDRALKGTIGRDSPEPVQLRVALKLRGVRKPVLSKPFGGFAGAIAITEDVLEYEDVFGLYTACHSHWYGLRAATRFTVCHGPCPAGPCGCGTPPARSCTGWCFCWC
jgi:hypothetical protein